MTGNQKNPKPKTGESFVVDLDAPVKLLSINALGLEDAHPINDRYLTGFRMVLSSRSIRKNSES